MHAFLLSGSGENGGSFWWCGVGKDVSLGKGGVTKKGESFLFLRNEHCTHLSRGSVVFLAWVGVV